MAYVLGVMAGDGACTRFRSRRGRLHYVIHLTTKDEEFARSFAEALKQIGVKTVKVYCYETKNPRWHPYYWHVFANCKFLVEWLMNIGVEELRSEVVGFERDFIRGFYESDGSIYVINRRYLCIEMVNRDEKLIALVKELLDNLGYHFMLDIDQRKDGGVDYRLRLTRQDEISRFLREVNPVIKRRPRGECVESRSSQQLHHPLTTQPSYVWGTVAGVSPATPSRVCELP